MPEISGMIQNYLEGQIKTIAGEPVIQSKTINENGTYIAPEGVDGYSPVVVNVPAPQPVIESKTINENGTYTAPEGVDGYSPVVVNVPLPQNAYLLKSVANLPQAIVSFNDGQEMVMPTLKVAIEPQQEGSGDPSPTNVRHISGWDKVVVMVADDAESPTTSHEYIIDLDGTRYGGELDVVSGVLTVDMVYKQVKDFEWRTQSGSYGRFFTVPSGADKALSDANKILIISDTYKGYSDEGKPANTDGIYVGSGGSIKIWDSEYPEETDVDVWKTARANVELCYYLATLITIQLTPTAVKSLRGVNNVDANTGDIKDAEYFSKEV